MFRLLSRIAPFLLPSIAIAAGEVIIDSKQGNGGFRSKSTGLNGSPIGWSVQQGVWIAEGNSPLSSAPFGPDRVLDSRFIQLHHDEGDVLTSATSFSVAAGDKISLTFDWRASGAGNGTTLEVSLWDVRAEKAFADLGTLSSETGPEEFIEAKFGFTAPEARENLRLRFALSNAGGLGRDFHLDRVHLSGGTLVRPGPIGYATEHYLDSSDSRERMIAKAARVLPKPKQVAWQRMETTFFIHFGPNTFSGVEWGNGRESPVIFNPTAFDAAQWVDVVKRAGGKMLVLVAKHHDGFCLYPSRYTKHDVASSPWLGGKGDVVRAVADACAAAGIKLGIYLSPADLYQIEAPLSHANGSGYYGNGSEVRKSTIPTDPEAFGNDPSIGRPTPEGRASFVYEVDDYNRYFLNQLYELLTEYGEIAELWFDGANPKPGTNQTYDYAKWYEMIYALQPGVCLFGGPDVRWVGNEAGYARESEWSVVPQPYSTPELTDLGGIGQLVAGKTLSWFPAEADTKVLSGWFWKASHAVKTTSELLDIYHASVGRNANLLLNLSPDTRGLIPDEQITPLLEAASVIDRTYTDNLAKGGTFTADSTLAGQPASSILDGDLDTWWEPGRGNSAPTLMLAMPSAITFDRVVLQEAIATRGQRIEAFAVDAWIGSAWKELAKATTVGHKRILSVPATTTDRLRIRILQSRLEPSLASFGLHKLAAAMSPPVIQNRDSAGRVAINCSNGNVIHFTTDGSAPTPASPLYAAPIDLPLGGTVKAISHDGSSSSFITSRLFPGIAPMGWRVVSVTSEEAPGEAAVLAIDDNPSTIWHTSWSSGTVPHPHFIAIDMGQTQRLRGFTYLPRQDNLNGVALTYQFEVSANGQDWTNVAGGEFGNIRNSPVLQEVTFAAPVDARYFRFTSLSGADGGEHTSAAEISVLPADPGKSLLDKSVDQGKGNP